MVKALINWNRVRQLERPGGWCHRVLVNRYSAARDQAPSTPQLAAASTQPATPSPRPAFAPDTTELTDAYAAAARMSAPPTEIADLAPVFHGLFRTSAGREAVAPVVSALWSAPTPVADAPAQGAAPREVAPPPQSAGAPMSLFQDQAADARALFRGRV